MNQNYIESGQSRTRISGLRLLVAFALSLVVVLLQTFTKDARQPVADEFVYISIAHDLNEQGIFSDGKFAKPTDQAGIVPGRFFAPAYPAFLSALSKVSPELREFLRCQSTKDAGGADECSGIPTSLRLAQAILAAIGMTAVFLIALTLSGSTLVAGLALLIALFTGKAAYYAGTALSENGAFLGFYLFLGLGTVAFASRKASMFAFAGVALALAILSRPSYLYLFYALMAVLIVLAIWKRPTFRISNAFAFAIATVVVLAPWLLRNYAWFGSAALTDGYGGYILVQRVAYNAMSWTEWLAFIVYGLPDFGDNLAKSIFGAEAISRLSWEAKDGFYLTGLGPFNTETIQAAGGADKQLSYLLQHHIIGDLFKHVAVTIPVALRGMWAGKYIGLLALLLFIPTWRELARRGKLAPFLFLSGSLFFMVGLHGFVSVNVVRYNMPMVALYGFIIAFALHVFLQRKGWLGRFASV